MKRFGLIGFPLSHSFSQKFFTEKFEKEGITDCAYDNFPLSGINELPGLLNIYPDLNGLNVTIPYKEKVIAFLSDYNEVVKETGACNCIRISDGKLYGFNTDTIGFRTSLLTRLLPHHKNALILGKGGAAKAVAHSLKSLGIGFVYVTRKEYNDAGTIMYADLNEDIMRSHQLIINTTPLGTFPDIDSCPPILYNFISAEHYLYDLVYNPAKTLLLQSGEQHGAIIQNGAGMLIIQAEESWKIWNHGSRC